jgi:hypothetical protein
MMVKIWNTIITYFYETHKVSKEEVQRYSYKIRRADPNDYLSGDLEKDPDFSTPPK